MSLPSRRRVLFVQRRLTEYRVPLFERLRVALDSIGLELQVVYGQPRPEEVERKDDGSLGWGVFVANNYLAIGGVTLSWQPIGELAREADLVVLPHENGLLANFTLLMGRRRGNPRIAFWGHGANLQSRSSAPIRDRLKKWSTRQADWYFAYTDLSAALVKATGFPSDRITVVNNAVDTTQLIRYRDSITPEEVSGFRASLGIGDGPVGVYVGALHRDKRIEVLLGAAAMVRAVVPDFTILVVGDGPERRKVEAFCGLHQWARLLGAKHGREKMLCLAAATVQVNAGMIGLGILDSFAARTPLVATDCRLHSPEVAYVENGVNAVVTSDSLDAFTAAIVTVLRDRARSAALQAGCAEGARRYTLEAMVDAFVAGICRACDT